MELLNVRYHESLSVKTQLREILAQQIFPCLQYTTTLCHSAFIHC